MIEDWDERHPAAQDWDEWLPAAETTAPFWRASYGRRFTSAPDGALTPLCGRARMVRKSHCVAGLIAVAEESQQIQEQVDEIQIQIQRAQCGQTARRCGRHLLRHTLDLLSVPGCQAHKDEHA